jgi:3-hydroxybutyryl-CoA dehydrogenase
MKAVDVKIIGVLGVGIMGSGIAQTALLAGYGVVGRDIAEPVLAEARENIINGRYGLKGAVERGKISREQMDFAISRLKLTTRVEDLANCDIVIEAIGGGSSIASGNPGESLENKNLKLRANIELDRILKKEAIIASNTSTFTIADLAAVTKRKDKFIGMHWFRPANVMKLIEICWTKDTSEETIKCMEGVCDKLGKTHIRVKDVLGDTGFVAGRIFQAVFREADKIIEEGICKAEDIDIAMTTGFGWPMGPMGMRGGAWEKKQK